MPQVLFADGSVSVSPDSGPVWVPDSEVEQENNSQEENTKRGQSAAPRTQPEREHDGPTAGSVFCVSTETERGAQRGCWVTTTPCGGRVHTVGTSHKHVPTGPLLTTKATDPVTHEVRERCSC